MNDSSGTNAEVPTGGSEEDTEGDVVVVVSIDTLKHRCRTARAKVEALQIGAHREVLEISTRLLDGLLLEESTTADKSRLATDVSALETYVNTVAGEDGGSGQDPSAQVDSSPLSDLPEEASDGRVKLFSIIVSGLLTTPQLESSKPFETFMAMINSNIDTDENIEFDHDEAVAMIVHMSERGKLDWDEDEQMVSGK